jgi:hypothetical protein
VKSRIPLAYAGLLIVALVAVVGFAAFSPSSSDTTTTAEAEETMPADGATASARVASAVLALRVSDAESRTATTAGGPKTMSEDPSATSDETELIGTAAVEIEPSPPTESPSTTETPTTTDAPTTTNPPTTTDAPSTADTTPPVLKVSSPADGSIVDDRVVTFSGTTERGATVSSGPYEASVGDDGDWEIQLVLAPGPNGAIFTARDDAGNTTDVRIVITYEEPQAATTTTTTRAPSTTTTTSGSSDPAPKWSPLWPADAGGIRNVEAWRSLVAKYWPANLVDCALNIIDLESKGDPTAYNSRSNAEGLFQHLSKYWKGRAAAAGFKDSNGLYASPYNAEANIAAAWVIASAADPWHRPWTVNPYYGACQP